MKHWVLGGLLILVVAVGFTGVILGDNNFGPGGSDVVTRVVAADGTETLIIRDQDRHFFPFGLFIFPLGMFALFFLARGFASRGRWSGSGPWMRGGALAAETPVWFEEWHRKAHADPVGPPAKCGSTQDEQPA